jgi:hypothetical protein
MSDADQGRLKVLNAEAAAILDGLTADGVISGYRTGSSETYGTASDTTVLTVFAARGSSEHEVQEAVRAALPGNWHIIALPAGGDEDLG